MSTQTVQRSTTVAPRVNLLPPEIAEEMRFRSMRAAMVLALVFAVLISVTLYLQSAGEVSSAQQQLDGAQTESMVLQAKANKLANVPLVYGQVAAAEAELATAMGNEVRYSYLLNDLSLSINKNVWLTSMAVTQTDTPVVAPAGTPGAPVTGWAKPSIAKVTFAGTALSYNDVAAFLDFLAGGKNYSDPFVTAINASDPIGNTKTFTFMASVGVTKAAYTHRYDSKAVN